MRGPLSVIHGYSLAYLDTLGAVYASGVDQNGVSTGTASAQILTAAPLLTLVVAQTSASGVTVYGQLTDIDAAGETISFSGAASGTVLTDGSGEFITTLPVSSSGTIEASATDAWGQVSNIVALTVAAGSGGVTASLTPQLTLSAQVLPGHVVLLSGNLIEDDPAGATVTFSGAVSGSVTTDVASANPRTLTITIGPGVHSWELLEELYHIQVEQSGFLSSEISGIASALPRRTPRPPNRNWGLRIGRTAVAEEIAIKEYILANNANLLTSADIVFLRNQIQQLRTWGFTYGY